MFQPIIKWSGSKRLTAFEIVEKFPDRIRCYHEPFIGGGSVLRALLESGKTVREIRVSDTNPDLIATWQLIQHDPKKLFQFYTHHWERLNKDEDLNRKKQYFTEIRTRLNLRHDPADFFFIMRTAVNGMPRYNLSGEFNTAFHLTRKGIQPSRLKPLLTEWSQLLSKRYVQFLCCDYQEVQSLHKWDVLYVDPPFANTKGMYYGGIDYIELWTWLRKQPGYYFLSFDGKITSQDFTVDIPDDLYSTHFYLKNGNSAFRRVLGTSNNEFVEESLYCK